MIGSRITLMQPMCVSDIDDYKLITKLLIN